MLTTSDNHLFNKNSPFQSFINFTNCHQFLQASARKCFLIALHQFFSAQAFIDANIEMTPLQSERVNPIDLPQLFSTMKNLSYKDCEAAYYQLLANISKVSTHYFSDNSTGDSIYQIFATLRRDDDLNINFWGWVPKRYVASSSALKRCLDESKGILKLKIEHPSLLVAMQRLQYMLNHSEPIDVSLESLLHLYCFAEENSVLPLKDELLNLFGSILFNDFDQQELEELLPEFKILDKDSLIKALQDQTKAIRPMIRAGAKEVKSEWFDKENPFRSIARFTGRCCALPLEELPRFHETVDSFFSEAAFLGSPIPFHSDTEKKRFVAIDLPFLLETLQSTSKVERKRFIACIQKATGLALLQLKKRDQLHLIHNTYLDLIQNVQTAWIAVQDSGLNDQPLHESHFHGQSLVPWFAVDNQKSLAFEQPKQLVNYLLLALNYNVDSWIEKVCEALKEASKTPRQWEECSQHLIQLLNRKGFSLILKKYNIPNLKPKLHDLSSDQLWDLYACRLDQQIEEPEKIKKAFLISEREKQLQAIEQTETFGAVISSLDYPQLVVFFQLTPQEKKDTYQFLDQLITGNLKTEKTEELVPIFLLSHKLYFHSCLENVGKKISSLYPGKEWKKLSTILTLHLDNPAVADQLRKIKVPSLQPSMHALEADQRCAVFKFNMQIHESNYQAIDVVSETFGEEHTYLLPVLENFKKEATTEQLSFIGAWLALAAASKITQNANPQIKECCKKILLELNQPGFLLNDSTVSACVLKHLNAHLILSWQKIVYKQLTTGTYGDFAKYGQEAIYFALQSASKNAIIVTNIEELFDSSHSDQLKKALLDLNQLFRSEFPISKENKQKFCIENWLSDKQKERLAQFWINQGSGIVCNGQIISKEQIWETLCDTYYLDVLLLIEEIKKQFKGLETNKVFFLEKIKDLQFGSYNGYSVKLDGPDAKEMLDYILNELPSDFPISHAIKNNLINFCGHMAALSINKDKNLITCLKGEPHYFSSSDLPQEEEILKIASAIQKCFHKAVTPLAKEIKKELWSRFCMGYHVDLISFKNKLLDTFDSLDENWKNAFKQIIEELKKNKTEECEWIVERFFVLHNVDIPSAKYLINCISHVTKYESNFDTDRLQKLSEHLIAEINFWIYQEQTIQKFLIALPDSHASARNVLREMIRLIPLPKKEKVRFSENSLSIEDIRLVADFLFSQQATFEFKAHQIDSSTIWVQFCEVYQGELRLLQESVAKDENAPAKKVLLQVLHSYHKKSIGYHLNDLSLQEITDLKAYLLILLKTGNLSTSKLQSYLRNIITHLEVLEKIQPLKKYEMIGEALQALFEKKFRSYITIPALSDQDKLSLLLFFKETIIPGDDTPPMLLFKDLWNDFCHEFHLDSFLIEQEIESQYSDSPNLLVFLKKAFRSGLEGIDLKATSQNEIKAMGRIVENIQKNALAGKNVQSKMETVKEKLYQHFIVEWIHLKLNDAPSVKTALTYLVSSKPYSSAQPLQANEILLATTLWQGYAQFPEGLSKTFLKNFWDKFSEAYHADSHFIQNSLDQHFASQPEGAKFLKEMMQEFTRWAFYLKSEYSREFYRKALNAIWENNINLPTAIAIQKFLRLELPKEPLVSLGLKKVADRLVDFIQEFEAFSTALNQFKQKEVGDALRNIIEELYLKPKSKKLALTSEQILQGLGILEKCESDIQYFDMTVTLKDIKAAFCEAYSLSFVQESANTEAEKAILRVMEKVNQYPSLYLEPKRFEELIKEMQWSSSFYLSVQESLNKILKMPIALESSTLYEVITKMMTQVNLSIAAQNIIRDLQIDTYKTEHSFYKFIILDLCKQPAYYANFENLEKKISLDLMPYQIDHTEATEINRLLADHLKTSPIPSDLSNLLIPFIHQMNICLERLKLVNNFMNWLRPSIKYTSDYSDIQTLVKSLWLPAVQKRSSQDGSLIPLFLEKEAAIKIWCSTACPSLIFPSVETFFKDHPKLERLTLVFKIQKEISENKNKNTLQVLIEWLNEKDFEKISNAVNKSNLTQEQAKEIHSFLSQYIVQRHFDKYLSLHKTLLELLQAMMKPRGWW